MANCLGISIENNLIKYAKLAKDHDSFKVEAFGIKFYEDLQKTLTQIIDESGSSTTPISINLSDEMYNYFTVFSLLNKKDIKKALKTEFEVMCDEKGYNYNALDSRYLLTKDYMNKEKIKAIYISVDKAEIARKLQQLDQYKIGTLSPLPIALQNLVDTTGIAGKENQAIINIDDKTTITTIIESQITTIDIIDTGMGEILQKIVEKENSYAKAYEICKNTTIYTVEPTEAQLSGNEYLEDIMPTLYNIVAEVKKILDRNLVSIAKVYITGSASVINNIEMYFQEYLDTSKCEILVPYFIDKTSGKVNAKDYIEVNSAIALAMQGLGEGQKEVNFKNNYITNSITELLKMDIGSNKDKKKSTKSYGLSAKLKNVFGVNLKDSLNPTKGWDSFSKNLLRIAGGLLLLIIAYGGCSSAITGLLNSKTKEVERVIATTNEQIANITTTANEIKNKTANYATKIQNLQRINEKISEAYKARKAIPNLLNQIMSVIPKGVQITSIETANENVTINAQSTQYEQLGYFTAKLKQDGILLNVKSSSGVKQESLIKVTIEGTLW